MLHDFLPESICDDGTVVEENYWTRDHQDIQLGFDQGDSGVEKLAHRQLPVFPRRGWQLLSGAQGV